MASVIFNGNYVKALKSLLNLNDSAYVLTGTDDPTSVAQNAPQGSIYMRTGSSGGRLYRKLDSGSSTNWKDVSSSLSGINYILNPDSESGVEGWSAYADAAGVAPVDGTGGSPTVTITRTTSSPLRGTGSFLITKDAANRQGEGVSYAFTIDSADKAKVLPIEFDYEIASGTFASGDSSDIRVYIYDVTNASVIYPVNHTIQGGGSLANHYQGTFQTAANSTSYRLILHVATTSTSAYTLKFDNVSVGPDIALQDSRTIAARYYVSGSTANASFADDVEEIVDFDTKVTDTNSSVTTGASWKYTAKTSGFYFIDVRVKWANLTNFADGGMTVYKNGSAYASLYSTNLPYDQTYNGSSIVQMNAGDYIDIRASQNDSAGGSRSISTSLSYIDIMMVAAIAQTSETDIVSARYVGCTSQSISSGGTSTAIDFLTKTYDTHNAVTTGASWKFTAPSTGYYRVSFSKTMGNESWTTGDEIETQIYKNGSQYFRPAFFTVDRTATQAPKMTSSDIVYLKTGEYIDLRVVNNGIASHNIGTDSSSNAVAIEKIQASLPISASETVAARVSGSGGGSWPAGPSVVTFSTTDYDSHSMVSGVNKITVPVGGLYKCNVHLSTTNASGTGTGKDLQAQIRKNGSTNIAETWWSNEVSGSSVFVTLETDTTVRLVAGDYIEATASRDGSMSATFQTTSARMYLELIRVGN